jgi:hypothetical protein
VWKRGMVKLLRHRHTKGPDSARQHLNRRATPRLHPITRGLEWAAGWPEGLLVKSRFFANSSSIQSVLP